MLIYDLMLIEVGIAKDSMIPQHQRQQSFQPGKDVFGFLRFKGVYCIGLHVSDPRPGVERAHLAADQGFERFVELRRVLGHMRATIQVANEGLKKS